MGELDLRKIKSLLSILIAFTIAGLTSVNAVAVQADNDKEMPRKTDQRYEFLLFEDRTLGSHVFDIIKEGKAVAFVDGKDYDVTIKGENVGNINKNLKRYNIGLDVIREKNEKIDKLVGRTTPKYVMQISDENGIPGIMTYDLHKTSFFPNSTVDLYQLSDGDKKIDLVMNKIPVDDKGNIRFDVQTAGRYVLVGASNTASRNPYDYERPQLFDIDELLSFEDNYFKLDDMNVISH